MGQTVATNKKAFRDFFMEEKWECGIALFGPEVKSVRAGRVNFKNAFARVDKGEVLLYNLYISPYEQAGYMKVEEDRVRKLLLHKREIKKITVKTVQKGLSLVPTKIYFNNRGLIKVELALGKGKKQFDKREAIKKRTIDKSLQRTLKNTQKNKR